MDKTISDDQMTIYAFAKATGDAKRLLRDAAISIHRREIRGGIDATDPFQAYMSEVDNPAPDLAYRGMLRAKLIEHVENPKRA